MNISKIKRFDLKECLDWLDEINPKYVCLYFLPEFNSSASVITLSLQQNKPDIEFVIMVSCTSGPDTVSFRCQDNRKIDAVIHFGIKCLCPTRYSQILPTFFISTIPEMNELIYVNNCLEEIKANSLLLFDPTSIGFLSELKLNHELEIAKFKRPNKSNWYFSETLSNHLVQPNNFDSDYIHEFKKKLSEYDLVIFIGQCQNLEFIISCKNIMIINPYKKTCVKLDGSKEFRKRISLIEKFKNSSKESIGIVLHDFKHPVCQFIQDSKNLCKKIKKIPYFITLNQFDYELRIGNFTQLTGFVFINSCQCDYEMSLQLSNYIHPIVFWKEFLIVCKQKIVFGGIQWNQDIDIDQENVQDDMENEFDEKNMILIERNILNQPSSWYGLVVNSGETSIADINEGRKGIASSYQNEQELF